MANCCNSALTAPSQRQIICVECGVSAPSKGGPQRYCAPCAGRVLLQRKRRANKKVHVLKGRLPIGSTLQCAVCSAEFIKTGPGRRYCSDQCRISVRRKGGFGTAACAHCGQQYQLRTGGHLFCDPCGEERARKIRLANQNKNRARRMKTDPIFVLNARMRAAIGQSLRGRKKGRRWELLVGYSREQLIRHIQRQFLPGMSWENIGKWHVDHIVPLSSFLFSSPEESEFRAAWAMTNLRPLWKLENLKKSSRRTHLL